MAALLWLSGCVLPRISRDGIGRRPDSADLVASIIVKGKTTKKEVLDRLGPPDQVMKGSEIPSARAFTVWMYETTYVSEYEGDLDFLLVGGSSAHEVKEKSYVIVYFNRRDIVSNFVYKQMGATQASVEAMR
jgi:hypothetical protein